MRGSIGSTRCGRCVAFPHGEFDGRLSGMSAREKPREDSGVRPRRYAEDPSLFGKALHILWIPDGPGVDRGRLRAAQYQHEMAFAIRKALKAQHTTIKEFAARTRSGYRHWSDALRGDRAMTLADLADAERILGIGRHAARASIIDGDDLPPLGDDGTPSIYGDISVDVVETPEFQREIYKARLRDRFRRQDPPDPRL
ncbi:helix-turn-helix transcriptional regulator [Salinibacterium sp. ZJ450]|uniref:helix-turn-helix domain-containing protein n=1 Tax=Salinibacterium sp. ZJ450 TaxID=2708338 RepID=UPI0014217C27|nr:helix-turn-helix transcriptional regulator [Salinibacterium sp. ZJ450]